ncbi:MAG: hypothetical protein ACOYMN_00115 [Roseimicrobium sp.]
MEPFSPSDPLFKLLGQAKPVEPRANFTQNVMRAIRQQPQTHGLWERCQEWLAELAVPRLAYTLATLALAALVLWRSGSSSSPTTGEALAQGNAAISILAPAPQIEVLQDSLDTALASELDSADTLSVLLAQQDSSALTDSEIALLLY